MNLEWLETMNENAAFESGPTDGGERAMAEPALGTHAP